MYDWIIFITIITAVFGGAIAMFSLAAAIYDRITVDVTPEYTSDIDTIEADHQETWERICKDEEEEDEMFKRIWAEQDKDASEGGRFSPMEHDLEEYYKELREDLA